MTKLFSESAEGVPALPGARGPGASPWRPRPPA